MLGNWLAHLSPEMTLVYARLSEDTLRKQWEQAMARGAVHIGRQGQLTAKRGLGPVLPDDAGE
jgi:hypothetical protein